MYYSSKNVYVLINGALINGVHENPKFFVLSCIEADTTIMYLMNINNSVISTYVRELKFPDQVESLT